MTIPKESPFSFYISPTKQALAIIVAMPVFILLFWLPSCLGIQEYNPRISWTIVASLTLLFGIGNSVLSLSAPQLVDYWGKSIFAYIIVLVVGICMAWLITGQNINELQTFKWMYIVFTFCYLLLLSIVQIMRKVMKIALDQDAALRGEKPS